MSLWKELKRRNVYKVGIAYLIVAWLIVQAAAIVFPHLNLPSWAVTFLIVFLIIGFPLILLFAWAFEITPDGLKWTKEVPHHESITHLTGKKLNYILAGLLVIAVGYIVIDKLYIAKQATQPEQVTVSGEAVAKKTIAVLPFVDISPEKDQEYFVDGLSEELLNTLTQIQDLRVTSRTSSFSFKGTNKTLQEVANALGVENILEGSVRKADSSLRITAQLIRVADDYHLWSKIYDRELKDIFEVQKDIATAVAGELSETLGIEKSLRKVGTTDNAKAYELYMIAQALYQGGPWDTSQALESIDAAIALDPKYALAWASKSVIHNALSTQPNVNKAVEQDAALSAAQKAIELEPYLAAAYYSLGVTKTFQGKWIDAELAYRKALELTTDPSLQYKVAHPYHYQSVANFKRANELLGAELRNDPLNQIIRAQYMNSFLYLDDMQRYKEEYERANVLSGDQLSMASSPIIINRMRFGEVIPFDELVTFWCQDDDECKQHIKSQKDFLTEIHQKYIDIDNITITQKIMNKSNFLLGLSVYAAYFGDIELAMDAMEKAIPLDYTNAGALWTPLMKEVRQTPRFKALVKKIGLVDYWNKFGWPDICHKLDNGDFECD